MRYIKIGYRLALSIILALLITLNAVPAQAAGVIGLYPREGEIGDSIRINGAGFKPHGILFFYLSSDEAEKGDYIGDEVTTYKKIGIAVMNGAGIFSDPIYFDVPDTLTCGEESVDVHDGIYYVYATYHHEPCIISLTGFIVIKGEIELDLAEGTVGSEVQISGQDLRPDQEIDIKYDDNYIDIASGDSKTDGDGAFICTIIIPDSTTGSHVITVIDESGDTPETEFIVEPQITIEPTDQIAGEVVNISGTGFYKRQVITITLDDERLNTTPPTINTNHYGSFDASFIVPFSTSHGTKEVEAGVSRFNKAEAQLTIWGGIGISPTTSPDSPGYVGMKLIIYGGGFTAGSTITITYSQNDETIPVDTVPTDYGNFSVYFTVPPSASGSHEITATDGTSTATTTFIMESQAPPTPVPLTPEAVSTAAARAYFDWEDVDDDSGLSFTLQVASDDDFNTILLEKEGLATSEYELAEEEKLEPTGKGAPYYWRVKAIDGAFNESEWSHPILFYVGFSWASIPVWIWYTLGGLVILLLGFLGFRLRRRARAKIRPA
jgi:hypothetical protein